jgi:hypothetical protein
MVLEMAARVCTLCYDKLDNADSLLCQRLLLLRIAERLSTGLYEICVVFVKDLHGTR